MKVILINGSPRAHGCTYTGLSIIGEKLAEHGIDSEIIQVGTKPVSGCIACMGCAKAGRCVLPDDGVNAAAAKVRDADGLVLGSPVHYASASGSATAFFDRLFYSLGHSGVSLRMKPGAAVVSCRRGGASATFDQLNKYFTINQMPVVSSCYWNQIHGYTPEDVYADEEGVYTLRLLADNMAYLLRCMEKAALPLPEQPPRVFTNFIR